MDAVRVDIAQGDADLEQILVLQRANVEEGLSLEEARSQGFVTLRHDLDLLREMSSAAPQVVARAGGQVVGYALAMLPERAARLPLLGPMFEELRGCRLQGRPVLERSLLVMGQVCVAREYRGRAVFGALYDKMRALFSPRFDLLVTELATRNARSARAHEKVGFELLVRYLDPDGEGWDLIAWSWREPEVPRGTRGTGAR